MTFPLDHYFVRSRRPSGLPYIISKQSRRAKGGSKYNTEKLEDAF